MPYRTDNVQNKEHSNCRFVHYYNLIEELLLLSDIIVKEDRWRKKKRYIIQNNHLHQHIHSNVSCILKKWGEFHGKAQQLLFFFLQKFLKENYNFGEHT